MIDNVSALPRLLETGSRRRIAAFERRLCRPNLVVGGGLGGAVEAPSDWMIQMEHDVQP